MIYCFDIDGTLCTNTEGSYEEALPYPEVIARVNSLFDAGHRIILYTARGSTTGIDWRVLTEDQLMSWGVKYHELLLGKPTADVYIDDKGVGVDDWRKRMEKTSDTDDVNCKPIESSVLKKRSYLEVTYSEERAPFGRYPQLLAKWLLDHYCKKPGRILDIGCGRGDLLDAFEGLGFEVAGIDISPLSAALCTKFEVKTADLEKDSMPFAADSFDFVFSKSVIEHMNNPTCLLEKALKVLRPGGTALIMTPSWEHTYWGPFYIDHTHVTPFTLTSLRDALAITGFESIEAKYFYQLPILWRKPFIKPIVWAVSKLPLPYRPYKDAPWSEGLNKFIRFSKEVMLLGIARKPKREE